MGKQFDRWGNELMTEFFQHPSPNAFIKALTAGDA